MKKIFLFLVVFCDLLFSRGVKPVDNQLFLQECGTCHFAYQPGLLPRRSWIKMMSNLENHFGVDASLDEADNKKLLAYMVKNASDNSRRYRSKIITKYIKPNTTPLRMTQTYYFKLSHSGLKKAMILKYAGGHITECIKCHPKANQGLYNDEYIRIPGFKEAYE
jgi:hypothetical protein